MADPETVKRAIANIERLADRQATIMEKLDTLTREVAGLRKTLDDLMEPAQSDGNGDQPAPFEEIENRLIRLEQMLEQLLDR